MILVVPEYLDGLPDLRQKFALFACLTSVSLVKTGELSMFAESEIVVVPCGCGDAVPGGVVACGDFAMVDRPASLTFCPENS